jgi:putative glutamine amidotransferase
MSNLSPLIGISAGTGLMPIKEGVLASHYAGMGYVRMVAMHGGLPVLLPGVEGYETDLARGIVANLDGLVLSGGNDIAPEMYGGNPKTPLDKRDLARDRFEVALVHEAKTAGIPVLGICRGMELINVAYGGTIRHGATHENAEPYTLDGLEGALSHDVEIVPGTRAHTIFGSQMRAICLHHQAADTLGKGLVVSAVAADGIIEIIEDPDRWVLGVLWHPEQAIDGVAMQARLYGALVEIARERASLRTLQLNQVTTS